MTRKEYWELFKETGKIEYYIKYRKELESGSKDRKEV